MGEAILPHEIRGFPCGRFRREWRYGETVPPRPRAGQRHRRDIAGNVRKSFPPAGGRESGRTWSSFPRWFSRVPAGGPAVAGFLRGGEPRGVAGGGGERPRRDGRGRIRRPGREGAGVERRRRAADGRVLGVYRKMHLPTTASSTRCDTSAGDGGDDFPGGDAGRITICEDIWVRRGRWRGRRRGGEPDPQHLGVAVPRGEVGGAASLVAAHARRTDCRWRTATSWEARTSWSSTAGAWWSRPGAM